MEIVMYCVMAYMVGAMITDLYGGVYLYNKKVNIHPIYSKVRALPVWRAAVILVRVTDAALWPKTAWSHCIQSGEDWEAAVEEDAKDLEAYLREAQPELFEE
jgi:hypothetical protein